MLLDVGMDYISKNTESTLKSITGVLEGGFFINHKNTDVPRLTS